MTPLSLLSQLPPQPQGPFPTPIFNLPQVPWVWVAVTAQLRFWFGDDPSPLGLDADVADQYELEINIDSKD